MNLHNITNELNEITKINMKNGTKEVVSKAESEKDMDIVTKYFVHNEEDVLLFCSALNLLNTYVKQKDSDINYQFKGAVARLAKALCHKTIGNIKVDFHPEENNLLIIKIFNMQFSFHGLRRTGLIYALASNDSYSEKLEWDGIRKQTSASTIFNKTYNSIF